MNAGMWVWSFFAVLCLCALMMCGWQLARNRVKRLRASRAAYFRNIEDARHARLSKSVQRMAQAMTRVNQAAGVSAAQIGAMATASTTPGGIQYQVKDGNITMQGRIGTDAVFNRVQTGADTITVTKDELVDHDRYGRCFHTTRTVDGSHYGYYEAIYTPSMCGTPGDITQYVKGRKID